LLNQTSFFRFGYIKQKIVSQEFLSVDDLHEAIRETFDHLSRFVLESVFYEWMIHFQTFINHENSYFIESQTMTYSVLIT
jgi:hypothetical protein